MLKYLVSAKTATGDTVKTLIDTITLPAGAKGVLGVWSEAFCGAGMTTLENISGILELESPDINIQPCQVPLTPVVVLTSGVGTPKIQTWALNWAVKGGERISGYITMDLAQTIALTGRFGLIVDVPV
jgi:hypothetical protein